MQLLAKNSNVKDSLIQTETINMQSPLKDGIITGHLLYKHHALFLRIENKVVLCYRVWLHALTQDLAQDSGPSQSRSLFRLK